MLRAWTLFLRLSNSQGFVGAAPGWGADHTHRPERPRQRGRCQLRGGGFGLRCFRCKVTAGLSYPQNLWITRRAGALDGTYFGEIGALLKQYAEDGTSPCFQPPKFPHINRGGVF